MNTSPLSAEAVIRIAEAFKAAKNGDVTALENSLTEDAKIIHARNKNSETLLRVAAKCGQPLAVEILLTHGANPTEVCGPGRDTALFAAIEGCNQPGGCSTYANVKDVAQIKGDCARYVKTIEALTKSSIDLNTFDGYGYTPLHRAVYYWVPLPIIEAMVAKGADIHRSSSDGKTSLHIAASTNRLEVVKFLLSKGADINAKTAKGETPTELAANNGYTELARFLFTNVKEGTVGETTT